MRILFYFAVAKGIEQKFIFWKSKKISSDDCNGAYIDSERQTSPSFVFEPSVRGGASVSGSGSE